MLKKKITQLGAAIALAAITTASQAEIIILEGEAVNSTGALASLRQY